jgi:hypothetical protein
MSCEGLEPLVVTAVGTEQERWCDERLDEGHYLGAGVPAGDYLRQVVLVRGRVVAVLAWGASCYALKDRDRWIGWSALQRQERTKLVVQNRRYLLLTGRGREPNLASRVMGAALRALPGQWLGRFGYRPLLAETFTDPEGFAGTCYKASNWIEAGTSAGYSRSRPDFYVFTGKPKLLWLYRLDAQAQRLLKAAQVPEQCRRGLVGSPTGILPVAQEHLRPLMEVFDAMPDPRAANTVFRLGSILAILALALLAGRREYAEIGRFACRLSQRQRELIGLPVKRGTKFRRVPGMLVFFRLVRRLDVEAFAEVLSKWLAVRRGTLPEALAMDGKMIRDQIGLLTLTAHEDGSPVHMRLIDSKEGTQRPEIGVGAKLLAQVPNEQIDGKIITADALHCQRDNASTIVSKGGEYLLQVKGNQPALAQQAKALDEADKSTPFLSTPKRATDG